MTYAIVSIHTPNYKELADATWPNKVDYAERHGYIAHAKTDGFTLEHASGEKVPFIKEFLNANPNVKWVWWLDTDTLITNYNKRIEEFLDDNYHFIITKDNNGINAGSFFVRNSLEGHAYLDYMLAKYPEFKEEHGFFGEQMCMAATYEMSEWQPLIKIIPQKLINAYDVWPNTWIDFSTFASWEPGDFVVHWPGSTMDTRLTRHVPFYKDKIIK